MFTPRKSFVIDPLDEPVGLSLTGNRDWLYLLGVLRSILNPVPGIDVNLEARIAFPNPPDGPFLPGPVQKHVGTLQDIEYWQMCAYSDSTYRAR